MTKKSQARLARDAHAKKLAKANDALENTNVWDGVNEISEQCARLLITHTDISQLSGNKEILEAITDLPLFAKNVNMLGRDLESLNTELVGLRAQHANKSGRASTPDEHIEGIALYEKYMLFMERHNNVVMPTATHLAEQIQEAVDRVAAKKLSNYSPEQDPSVITDVEVIEKPASNSEH